MGTDLAAGDKAPAFTLPRDGGGNGVAGRLQGPEARPLFLSAGRHARAAPGKPSTFRGCAPQFAKAGTEILGVSADPVKAQDAFKKKHDLTIALLSDETHKMLEAYGVWGKKSMYGKSFMGIVRTTVLIGPDGRIARIWPKVKVDGHAEEVLAAAKAPVTQPLSGVPRNGFGELLTMLRWNWPVKVPAFCCNRDRRGASMPHRSAARLPP